MATTRKKTTRSPKKTAPRKTARAPRAGTDQNARAHFERAMQHISNAVMMVDRDFVVTYVNNTTEEMLERHAHHFRQLWPNFDPKKIIGMCIDTFHKNPAHQRQMLADPKNLPHRAQITVGPLKFALNVGARFDAKGNYDGNILEWADVTEQLKQEALNNDYRGYFDALGKSQAVITFDLSGKIMDANENLLRTLGYTLEEIRGQHHSMFVDAEHRQSAEYRQFWEKLGRGEFDAGQYKRVAKGGREVWLQASYNPIPDVNGKAYKVVKYATDVTEQVMASKALQRAVEETRAVVSAAEANDITKRIPLEGKSGDIENLCVGVNGLLDRMTEIIKGMTEASETIADAAREIATGNMDLSQRTEEQASSLQQTAASLEQLTGTVRQNSENAQQANKLASTASDVAVKGGTVVSDVVRTMDGISESSRKIAEIIGVIDEIAFQTNILALNAAVEAARAGDQGRGFAVVATEVRNLAQRSANAAKEIKALISDSVGKVESGSKLVDSAGKTMDEIVQSVKRVTDIMAEISAASREQSGGIEQVNTAVAQMDRITQQNAALVEEAAAAAKSMEEQTDQLSDMVSVFKLTGGERAPRQTKAPVAEKKAAPAPRPAMTKKVVNGAQAAAAVEADWQEF